MSFVFGIPNVRTLTQFRCCLQFLAAPSSSRRLFVRPLVGDLCEKVTIRVSNGNLNLPTYRPMRQ